MSKFTVDGKVGLPSGPALEKEEGFGRVEKEDLLKDCELTEETLVAAGEGALFVEAGVGDVVLSGEVSFRLRTVVLTLVLALVMALVEGIGELVCKGVLKPNGLCSCF